MAASDDDLLCRKDASKYLETLGCAISAKTMANLASNNNAGRGPPFTRFRWRIVRYRRRDLKAWAEKEGERVA